MKKIESCPICDSSKIKHFITTSAQMHPDKEAFKFDQCENCKYVFLNPKVDPNQLEAYYTEYYLPYRGPEAWGKFKKLVDGSFKKLDSRKLNTVKHSQPLTQDSLVLDIGCGQPSFLKLCQEKEGCRTLGLDFSDNGWRKHNGKYESLSLQVGEISDLSQNLKPDVITMWHYLEHDYTPLENLKYLRSISKSTTKLIIEVPNFDSSSRKKFGQHWAGWHTPRHPSLFSHYNLELLLKKSNWKVEQNLNYGTMDPYLIYWMSKMEKRGIEWDKNMEKEIVPFITGMISFLPKRILEKKLSLGVMTIIATPIAS
ncbi:class I SAM-dependent methyltransferase [Psychroflexus tropicus]|uniref:class I SAM-dependent methyltransferase n=1 Tax=Psychroflexus tropicus TaxID=197345 RepID=UPI000477E091|nr:class I SAM-dependent methyltransferase [Psychroflexus tropicus]